MDFITTSISQKGRFHEQNEDSFAVQDDYVVIADGMGGESSGDVASQLAVLTISTILNNHLKEVSIEEDIRALSFRAIKEADAKIMQYVAEHPDSYGMGTTVVLIIKREDKGYIAWCGDSRCYIYSDETLTTVTKDHSYVQGLIDDNKITVDESFMHPDNNVITRFVGGGEDMCIPEFVSCELKDESTIVLCSDGLSGYCKNEDIEKIISSCQSEELPSRLHQLAIQNGSDDDITIVTMTPQKKSTSIWNWLHNRNR